jgi:hypothetical protein
LKQFEMEFRERTCGGLKYHIAVGELGWMRCVSPNPGVSPTCSLSESHCGVDDITTISPHTTNKPYPPTWDLGFYTFKVSSPVFCLLFLSPFVWCPLRTRKERGKK